MTSFIRVFRSELIKSRRTKGFLISILFPFAISLMFFFIYYIKYEYFVVMGTNPWELMGANEFRIMGVLIMPLYLLLTAYVINFTEHKSKSWKCIFTLPVPKFYIYASKILLVIIWLVIFIITSCLFFFATGLLLSYLRPELQFRDYDSTSLVIKTFLQLFVSGFGILSIQFFLSIYWNDFIRPVGLGIGLIIIATLLNSWEYIYILPFSHPYYVAKEFSSIIDENIPYYLLYGFLISIVFFIGGYFMVSRKETK